MNLSVLQNPQGFYPLFDLSFPQLIAQTFGLDMSIKDNQEYLAQVTAQLLAKVPSEVMGIATETEFSLPAFFNKNTVLKEAANGKVPGLIIRLDCAVPDLPGDLPAFSPEWGVEQVANNYAVGLLELHYHPAQSTALQKKQIVAEISDYCKAEGIPLILKLQMSPPSDNQWDENAFHEAQLNALQELRGNCHMVALEPPRNALAAATVTAELDVPWIMIGNQKSLVECHELLRQSMDSGAQGFLAGEVLWSEIYSLRRGDQGLDEEAIAEFIKTQIPTRLQELVEMANQTVKV